jgi:hypothetical protein
MRGLSKLLEPGEKESTGDAWQDRMRELGEKMRAEVRKGWNIGLQQNTRGLRGLKASGTPSSPEEKTPNANGEPKVRLVLRGGKTRMRLEGLRALRDLERPAGERRSEDLQRLLKVKEIVAEYREEDDNSGGEKRELRSTSGPALYPSEPALDTDQDQKDEEMSQALKIVRSIRRKGERGQGSLMRRRASKPALWTSGAAGKGRTA